MCGLNATGRATGLVATDEIQQDQRADHKERSARQRSVVITQPVAQGPAANLCAHGVAQVEGDLDAGSAQQFAAGRMLQDERLLR